MDQAEQLRNMVREQNRVEKKTARVITITSGKGGVGKSNVAVNLAVQFRKMGKRVIIFDADIGLANVEVMLGAVPQYNLSDLIYRGKNIKDIITEGPMEIGFISGGSGISGLNNLSKDQIVFLVHSLAELNELADIIIIDTGAGISDSVLEFVIASPEILLVTTPEPSSLTDSYSLLKALHRNPTFAEGNRNVDLVANKVLSDEEGDSVYERVNSVVERFLNGRVNFLGMIPADSKLEKAVRAQKVVSVQYPEADASKAFEVLANNLLNHGNELYTMHKGITQLFIKFITREGH
ncbi:MAG: MinD/ParA family protein [Lachnospiraceae bacterium]|nr:MinD/ParA family protein [Lachnospiraceae bacterium]